MTIAARTTAALEVLGYPVIEEGSAPPEPPQETYLTIFRMDTVPRSHAYNRPRARGQRMQVKVWSTDPEITQNADNSITGAMAAAGFLFVNARQLPQDEGYYGWVGDYRYYETEV